MRTWCLCSSNMYKESLRLSAQTASMHNRLIREELAEDIARQMRRHLRDVEWWCISGICTWLGRRLGRRKRDAFNKSSMCNGPRAVEDG